MLQEPDWDALSREQQRMASAVVIPDNRENSISLSPLRILTLDIQYAGDDAHVGIAFQASIQAPIETSGFSTRVSFPYKTGYFAYREGPALLDAVARWESASAQQAELIVIDGHGIAHPRGLGLASWVGVKLDRAVIGIAKRPMAHMDLDVPPHQGAKTPLKRGDKTIGYVLCTQAEIKPIYVSPGHLIHVDHAAEIALALVRKYRIPEPLRMADQHARALARGEIAPTPSLT